MVKKSIREGELYEYCRTLETIDDMRGSDATDLLLEELGLSRDLQKISPSDSVELSSGRLTYTAQQRLGIQGLGFYVAKRTNVTDLGIFGYAMLSAATIGKAIEIGTRYNRSYADFTFTKVIQKKQSVAYQFFVHGAMMAYNSVVIEQWMAIAWHFLKQLRPEIEQGELKRVNFSFPSPRYHQQYRNYYNAPVFFEQTFSEFVFEKDILDRPIGTASLAAGEILSQQCDRIFDEIKREGGIVDAVREELMKGAGRDWMKLDHVAQRLALSGRTLRRRLLEKGTTFNKISNEVRMTLAREYVLSTDMSNEEISYALGYSQASAFQRAFQSWHGKTPKALRKFP